MNIRKSIIGVALGVVMLGSVAVPTYAAPGDNGQGVGGCVDNFYGNATNPRPSGNGVLPSQSPGPFTNQTGGNEAPRNDRVRGSSVGDVMQHPLLVDLNGKEVMEIVCIFP